MNRIVLPTTGIETSAVGLGTAGLTSVGSERAAVRLLNAAFEAGITHFDTAPLYGRGQVEALVGTFLRGKRERVTVTTKVGLYPSAFDRTFRVLLGPLRRVKRALLRPADVPDDAGRSEVAERGSFDPQQVTSSFEASLRELRTDYVDFLLLHECFVEDTVRPDLIDFIGRQIERGTVRAAGIGTARTNLQDRADGVPELYRIFQYDINVSTPETMLPGNSGRALVSHSALGPLSTLVSVARKDPARSAHAQSAAGVDFTDPAAVASMLLHYARRANRNGVMLFATTKLDHLHANLASLRRDAADEQVSRFADVTRALLAPAGT